MPPKTDGSGPRPRDPEAGVGPARRGRLEADRTPTSSTRKARRSTIEILIDAQVFERILTPYANNLKALGITATVRQVDPTQYAARLNAFDFDMILEAYGLAATPLDGLAQLFKSTAADQPGSRNYAGIKEPAIDAALAKLPRGARRATTSSPSPASSTGWCARGTTIDAGVVSRQPPHGLLGHLRAPGDKARLRLHAGNDLVVRPRQGRSDRLHGLGDQ